jgi:hypothetical protein
LEETMENLREADVSFRAEPSVDVGIPTLGNCPYIVEAIESVLSQTFTAWRLVISENGTGNPRLRRRLFAEKLKLSSLEQGYSDA